MRNDSANRTDRPGALGRAVAFLRTKPTLALLLIAGVALLVFLGLSALFRTEAGEAWATVEAVRAAVERGDAAGVMEHVSPFFNEEGLVKDQLGRALKGALRRPPFVRVRAVRRRLDVRAGTAGVWVAVQARRWAGPRGESRSEWRVELERIDDRWLVRQATPVEVNGRRIGGLRILVSGY